MRRRILALLMTLTMTAMVLPGCNGSDASGKDSGSSDTIKIGTSFPMTGTLADDGNLCVDSVKLAVDQCNEEGGINGKKVEIVSEDDESSPTAATNVANKFAEDSILQ